MLVVIVFNKSFGRVFGVVVENELMMTRTAYDSSEAGGSITKLFAHANDLSPDVV